MLLVLVLDYPRRVNVLRYRRTCCPYNLHCAGACMFLVAYWENRLEFRKVVLQCCREWMYQSTNEQMMSPHN
jgi:hypothetical protein